MVKTYLIVWFHSEGQGPSVVNERLLNIGFRPTQGNYDYVYDWGDRVDTMSILDLGDKIITVLRGSDVLYKMETA